MPVPECCYELLLNFSSAVVVFTVSLRVTVEHSFRAGVRYYPRALSGNSILFSFFYVHTFSFFTFPLQFFLFSSIFFPSSYLLPLSFSVPVFCLNYFIIAFLFLPSLYMANKKKLSRFLYRSFIYSSPIKWN